MELANAKDWITLVSAIIAACASAWSLWLQLRGKHDNFTVGLDDLYPTIREESMMHVVSRSDHPITIVDWGFINELGLFESIPLDLETLELHSQELAGHGSNELAGYGARFTAGYTRRKTPLGAFAKSSLQKRPVVYLSPAMPWLDRARLRLKLIFKPNYFRW